MIIFLAIIIGLRAEKFCSFKSLHTLMKNCNSASGSAAIFFTQRMLTNHVDHALGFLFTKRAPHETVYCEISPQKGIVIGYHFLRFQSIRRADLSRIADDNIIGIYIFAICARNPIIMYHSRLKPRKTRNNDRIPFVFLLICVFRMSSHFGFV